MIINYLYSNMRKKKTRCTENFTEIRIACLPKSGLVCKNAEGNVSEAETSLILIEIFSKIMYRKPNY